MLREVRREALAACVTCPLCHKLLRQATTIIECLHTFCRKCIHKKLLDEEMHCCPICKTDLGCAPLEKLRPDHNLQDIRAKVFPHEMRKAKSPEVAGPVIALPAKRKERSLSYLVASTPRVSARSGMTGRRTKSTARKASRGSSLRKEKTLTKEDDSIEDCPESASSPETFNNNTRNMRLNSDAGEPSNLPSTWQGKVDLRNPLDCLVEAASTSKSAKFGTEGSFAQSETLHDDSEKRCYKTRSKEHRLKPRVQDEKNGSDYSPSESERPRKLRRGRRRKAMNVGSKISPQVVFDAASAKFDQRNYPIWFSLVALDEEGGDYPPLPQISPNYIRIKDGNIPVSYIQKYLMAKLHLSSEQEVEIKCMGQTVIPTLTLNNLVDLWLQKIVTDRVSVTIGSSAKDFVMVLGYARRVPDSRTWPHLCPNRK